MTTSGSPRSFSSSSGFASTTSTSRPASSSTRAATRPSPPFEPPPQTTVNDCALPKSSSACRATACPARSISSSTVPSYRSSAARISAAV